MSNVTAPRVLLTNDDGPPDARESPYILGLYRHLTEDLGWDVKVVVPSSQKSWIGKAYHIKETIKGSYFYPKEDGSGERSESRRPLKSGEIAEWILLDGTPATCSNVALHNLYPGQIDLVVSGPNLGRNSSSAFALSSGTIGAAMSAALSRVRGIAVSYGTVLHPTPKEFFDPAHKLAGSIVKHLWQNWGEDEAGLRNKEVDLYSVNIPLIEGLLSPEGLKIVTTTMWRNSYGRLFKAIPHRPSAETLRAAGPDALGATATTAADDIDRLQFQFAPDMTPIINPDPSSVPHGTDGWAVIEGLVSVTPLRASFGEPSIAPEERTWQRL